MGIVSKRIFTAETQRRREMNEESRKIKDKFFLSPRLCVSALIIFHLLITLPFAYFLNIWADEASTLYTTERGFFYALQNALADEKQAPLYFWLLSLWRELNGSIFFARLFSIICSLLAIKFFYDFARKVFDEKAAVFVTACFALHPYLIWASLEIRVYSLVILLSVLLLKFWFGAYFQREDAKMQRREECLFVIFSVLSLYTNYYIGFLLVGLFVSLLVSRKFSEAKRFFIRMIFVGLTILPLIWAIKQQFAVNTAGFQGEKSFIEGLQILWNHFLTFIFPTEIFTPEEQSRISFLRVWLVRFGVVAVVFLLARKFYKIRRSISGKGGSHQFILIDFDTKILIFSVIAGTVGLFLLGAYFLLGAGYVEIRHAAVLFAPLVLFVFTVLLAVLPRKSWIVFALILAGLYSYSIYALYPNLAKRGDWARVAEFIEQREKPNQPVVIFTTFDALALPYHYRGANKILPDEKFFDWELEAEAGSENAWKRQTEFIISKIPPDTDEIWLLTNEKCDVKDSCLPLENFVQQNYNIVEEKDFYLEKVRLLRKKK